MEGESVASIARCARVSEPTVRKFLKPRDMSPPLQVRKRRPSVMDRYAGIVDGWLEEGQATGTSSATPPSTSGRGLSHMLGKGSSATA